MTEEIRYKEIPGFPGYWACTDGSIWTAWKSAGPKIGKRNTGKPYKKMKFQTIRPTAKYPRNNPYFWVGLRDRNNKTNIKFVHEFILWAFNGPRQEGQICRHLDGNCQNNKICNLEWGTNEQNWDDKKRHGTCKTKLNPAKAAEIRKLRSEGLSVIKIASRFGVTRNTIYGVLNNKYWAES